MSGVFFLKNNVKMEQIQPEKIQVVVKSVPSNGIILQNTKGKSLNEEEIKTTEYFLEVEEQDSDGDIHQAQYVTIENQCEDSQDVDSQFVPLEIDDNGQIILEDKDVILWDELCRICANTSDKVVPIFFGEGLKHNLCKKIENYLPFSVSEEDTLPLQVCYNCAATLLAWHEMTQNCLSAQQRLIELQNKLNLKNQVQNSVSVGEDEEIIDNGTEMETTSNQDDQVEDEKKIELEDVPIINESETDRSCVLEDAVVIQVVTNEPIVNVNSKSRKVRAEQVKLKDPDSRTVEQNKKEHPAEIWINGVRCYSCPDCKRLSSTPYAHAAHLKSAHASSRSAATSTKQQRKWHCEQLLSNGQKCDKEFSAASSKKRHVRDVHFKFKQWNCSFCARKFASRQSRDEHERTHTNERPFECEACGKRFRQRASLSVHKRFHSRLVSFECEICGRQFARKQDCQRHVFTHAKHEPSSTSSTSGGNGSRRKAPPATYAGRAIDSTNRRLT
ncbi:transcription factor Ouib-like isoform X4 [Phymastichus coffea]|uniref:transcription factor Ouib-like isoform X4 n=1 Tax=Phymastichus coffea TaxID=108790 RepID=UPI00273C040A|nr:transcription factor Ouib-like isoform X4 [Phymastichus coffea]